MDRKRLISGLLLSMLVFSIELNRHSYLHADCTASQNLMVTIPTTVDLSVTDPVLNVVFDPMSATNGIQEKTASSSYKVTSIGLLRMIVGKISEELQGIDIFVKMGTPQGAVGGNLPVSKGEMLLSSTSQTLVSGIANCIGEGSIDYRLAATFGNIPEGSFNQHVVVVTYTITTSS